jgi:transposase
MKFMNYDQKQSYLLPPTLSECLEEDHLCFTVSDIVDDLDLSKIEEGYKEEGHPAYHPKMMIKILFYGYTQGTRSSRKLENKTREDIAFRYLTANSHLDHGTINLFRKTHLGELPFIFTQIIAAIQGLGLADFSDISLDGTKIKAQASRDNLFTKVQIDELKARFESFLAEAEKIDEEEDKKFGSKRGYNQVPERLSDPKTRKEEIRKIQKKLAKLDQAGKDIDRKQEEAQKREETKPKGRRDKRKLKNVSATTSNTTDPEANLMEMKNSSYKMAYNAQITASRQFIAAYDATNEATDTKSLPDMVKKTEENTKKKVKTVKADSAYFTKHSMIFLEDNQIDAFIPDRLKEVEGNNGQSRMWKKKASKPKIFNKYDRKNFAYDEKNDRFICPEGKPLTLRQKNIFGDGIREYRGTECGDCPCRHLCVKSKKKRYLQVDFRLDKMVADMRAKLNTPEGKQKYRERQYEVEPVFGNLTHNLNFNEFLCRGKAMAMIELGLISSAHNIKKIFYALKRNKVKLKEVPWDNLLRLQTN